MISGSYTYEDYLKDFELDCLGFDSVSVDPVPDLYQEEIPETEARPEADRLS